MKVKVDYGLIRSGLAVIANLTIMITAIYKCHSGGNFRGDGGGGDGTAVDDGGREDRIHKDEEGGMNVKVG